MEQQTHASGAVRHAEKRRIGSCQFANRVASVSLDAYKSSVPESYRDANKQTCVATIVAHYSSNNLSSNGDKINEVGKLKVIGLGVGTKFLSDDIIKNEQNADIYGKRIRDCHAEVLARRAFRRQIALEILADLKKTIRNDEFAVSSKTNTNDDHDDFSILERGCGNGNQQNICYRVKSNVTLHFYASSAPCGNATLKKFVKMEKEIFDTSLGPDEWPAAVHEPIAAHSLRLGQFLLLVKKDGSVSASSHDEGIAADNVSTLQLPEKGQSDIEQQPKRKKTKKWPCRENDSWCPPSCSIAHYNKGTIHSCSDKIARWNCLGLQGSLLMRLLESPLYMTTLTVGRKFSRAICQRAVCCRAEGFRCSLNEKYKLNHPALMETNIYLDDTGTHDMGGVKLIGEDASFDSTLCWAWWPSKRGNADCIDGKTGLVTHCSNEETINTYSLLKLSLEILSLCGVPATPSLVDEKLSLSELRMLKRQLSSQYESAKDNFLLRHRVFRDWSCRDNREEGIIS